QDVIAVIAKTTIFLTVASGLCFILRRASASTRHAVWIMALSSVALVPIAVAFVPHVDLPLLPASGSEFLTSPGESSISVVGVSVGRGLKPATTVATDGLFGVAITWIAVTILILSRLVLGGLAIRRLSRFAVPLPHGPWHDIVANAAVQLKVTTKPISPITWGIFRHTILLPSAALTWPAERIRLVLTHELAHVKRNDWIVQILIEIVCSL